MHKIGPQIKAARKKLNLTQRQLAEKLGVATGTIQQYELGKRSPDIQTLANLALALNTSVSAFIDPMHTPFTVDPLLDRQADAREALSMLQFTKFLNDHPELISILRQNGVEFSPRNPYEVDVRFKVEGAQFDNYVPYSILMPQLNALVQEIDDTVKKQFVNQYDHRDD